MQSAASQADLRDEVAFVSPRRRLGVWMACAREHGGLLPAGVDGRLSSGGRAGG